MTGQVEKIKINVLGLLTAGIYGELIIIVVSKLKRVETRDEGE